jgi:hypothetical protein
LITGVAEIDVDDWEAASTYNEGYSPASDQVRWFWQLVRSMGSKQVRYTVQRPFFLSSKALCDR